MVDPPQPLFRCQDEQLIGYCGLRKQDLDQQLSAATLGAMRSSALAFIITGSRPELTAMNVLSIGGEGLSIAKARVTQGSASKSRVSLSATCEEFEDKYKRRLMVVLQLGLDLIFSCKPRDRKTPQ
jgi:hypothetical protein